MSTDPDDRTARRRADRRRRLARSWAVAAVVWSLVRTCVAWALLGSYGLDPRVYLVVDLASALVLGRSFPVLVTSVVDRVRRRAWWAGVITVSAWAAPDVYLFTSTSRVPVVLVVAVLTVLIVGVVVTVVGTWRRVRRLRTALLAPATSHADGGAIGVVQCGA